MHFVKPHKDCIYKTNKYEFPTNLVKEKRNKKGRSGDAKRVKRYRNRKRKKRRPGIYRDPR